jgi:ZIP family zinc transporter
MGMLTALAIAIHNFPEGLATFLVTVADARVGASLGVAIAVHNIPEGLCVAMPIYYATGSKWKAFGWSLLSGVTEPIGGILGFAILQPVFTPLVFGIVFSMVSRSMIRRTLMHGNCTLACWCLQKQCVSFATSVAAAHLCGYRAQVGGMMVFIVMHELLPAAHKYMGNSAKATAYLLLGMVIMATSLVLFSDFEAPLHSRVVLNASDYRDGEEIVVSDGPICP